MMGKIQKMLLKRVDRLKKAYTDYQNNPYDPENAHRIRTHSRKLRSVLNFLRKTFDAHEYQKLNSELKELAMIYGPVREVDILTEWCAEIARCKPDMSDHYKDLFNHLDKERRKEMRRTFNKTSTRSAASAIENIESDAARLSLEEKTGWDSYIKKRLVKKNRRLLEAYDNVDMDDYAAVHEIRKKAKKVRFSAEYLGKLSSAKHNKMAKNAKRIQDEFGMITDAHVNCSLLETYAGKVDNEELKVLLHKMIEAQRTLLLNKNNRGGA